MTTINFELADSITDSILEYAHSVVVTYCEQVENFKQFFEDDEMTAIDKVIEDCFNGDKIDMTWWDDLSWFYTCNRREIGKTYGLVRQTGRERFGDDFDIPDKCYDNPTDFMILVAYIWIIENTDVVEEIIREFYDKDSEDSSDE